MSRLMINDLSLAGMKRLQRQYVGDNRGFLARLFCAKELATSGWTKPIAQINHTYTAKQGTVRGMHFQRLPNAEMKLVSCIRGEVWDVAVDLRYDSPTFLHWHAEQLSAENGCALIIPEGFAHGFQALTDDVELIYCHSAPYAPEAEAGLHPLEPRLAIAWPLPVVELSPRDRNCARLTHTFEGVSL
jgi:dTDP-4-dehydrorhamnose 3,5-epimerase